MEAKTFSVYMHTTPSGKRYVGITCMNPKKRWKNGKGYELCTAFNRAIKKYGWDQIKHEIVLTGLSKEEACMEEQRLIRRYKTDDRDFGYNLTSGGEHYEPNQEWRERLSASNKKYYAEHPEARQRISESQKGKKQPAGSSEKKRAAMLELFKKEPWRREKCGKSFRGKKLIITVDNSAHKEGNPSRVILNGTERPAGLIREEELQDENEITVVM